MTAPDAEHSIDRQMEALPTANVHENTSNSDGYILNHVALKVSSISASRAFYVDFLGMKEIFTVNTGYFEAHYLGTSQIAGESPEDMLQSLGSRSGLLELILDQDNETDLATKSVSGDEDTPQVGMSRQRHAYGFVHLGFRVPDVSETLRRARQLGWTVLKDVGETEIAHHVLPGRSSKGHQPREWLGGFAHTLAQIGFVADPDMNYVEILPKILC